MLGSEFSFLMLTTKQDLSGRYGGEGKLNFHVPGESKEGQQENFEANITF